MGVFVDGGSRFSREFGKSMVVGGGWEKVWRGFVGEIFIGFLC